DPPPWPLRRDADAQHRLCDPDERSVQADRTPRTEPLLLAAGRKRGAPVRALPVRGAEPGSCRALPLARRLALEQLPGNCGTRAAPSVSVDLPSPRPLRRRQLERAEELPRLRPGRTTDSAPRRAGGPRG